MTSIRDILASTGAAYTKDFIRHIRGNTIVVTLTRYAAMSFVRDWVSLQIECP